MKMLHVDSDAIEAIGYEAASRRMRIRFTGGREYDFCGVPVSIFQGLHDAPSKGTFYNEHIRGRYSCG